MAAARRTRRGRAVGRGRLGRAAAPAARARRRAASSSSREPRTSIISCAALRPTRTNSSARDLAASLGCRSRAGERDVTALARAEKRSIEDAARRARYAFLERGRRRGSMPTAVAVGAHPRRSGRDVPAAVASRRRHARAAGIRPKAGLIIRPLLDVRRRRSEGSTWRHAACDYREDATNADVAIPRNRVRHELIPYLRARVFARNRGGAGARSGQRPGGRREAARRSNRFGAFRRLINDAAHTAPLVDAEALTVAPPGAGGACGPRSSGAARPSGSSASTTSSDSSNSLRRREEAPR